jgi:hypothetical protein
MIIGGVALVSLKRSDIKDQNIKLLSGVKETILAAFLFGIFGILVKLSLKKLGGYQRLFS